MKTFKIQTSVMHAPEELSFASHAALCDYLSQNATSEPGYCLAVTAGSAGTKVLGEDFRHPDGLGIWAWMNHTTDVVTHEGIFHADECLALAVLEHATGSRLNIERRKPTEADLSSLDVYVVDCGGQWNPNQGNFDHHQDGEVKASNTLVLWHFRDVLGEAVVNILEGGLFAYVDQVDRGKIVETTEAHTINAMVRSLNGLPNGFEMALEMCRIALKGAINRANLDIEAEKTWSSYEHRAEVVIDRDGRHCSKWREFAQDFGVKFLLHPNREAGKWQVTSRSSEKFPIPADDSQAFRHPSGFMAVYPSYNAAWEHLEQFCETEFDWVNNE